MAEPAEIVSLTLTKSQKQTIRQALMFRVLDIRKLAAIAERGGNATEASRLTASAADVDALASRFR